MRGYVHRARHVRAPSSVGKTSAKTKPAPGGSFEPRPILTRDATAAVRPVRGLFIAGG